jgi:hypothetical protein
MMAAPHRSLLRIFLFPAVLAVVIGFGLLSALLGDGLWDALSWGTLALPLVVIGYYIKIGKSK